MPAELPNPYPTISEAEWEQAKQGVPREIAAARLVVAREIGGIPFTPYLRGDSDHAPVLRGVAGFTAKVYDLLDSLSGQVSEEAEAVRAAMEDFEL